MDVKEMREVADKIGKLEGCGCEPGIGIFTCSYCDARYIAEFVLLLTNPTPLTLDAAKAVMGREPRKSAVTLFVWDEESIFVTKNTHEERVSIVRMWGKDFYLPTIGQFACLVLAAKQGETT